MAEGMFDELIEAVEKVKEHEENMAILPALKIAINQLTDKLSQANSSLVSLKADFENLKAEVKLPSVEELLKKVEGFKKEVEGIRQEGQKATESLNRLEGINQRIDKEVLPYLHENNKDISIGKQTTDIDMGGHQVRNIGNPVADGDATPKKYVDDNVRRSMAAGGIGGGLATSELPAVNDVAVFTDTHTVKGQSEAEFKELFNLEEGTDYAAALHATNHTDGTDDIQDATSSVKGLATATQISKLDNIEPYADVTDATNVNAAGAVMEGDTAGGDLGGTYPNPTVDSASTTAAGKIEIATSAETTTGTDATRAVSPDGLAGSDYGKRPMFIKLEADDTALGTGDGAFIFVVPALINGWNLVDVEAHVTTVSSSGTPTYSIYNLTDSQDMLSTSITIDANEYTSATAATPAVINTDYDDVATGDRIEINKDVAGTGEKGDEVILVFQLP